MKIRFQADADLNQIILLATVRREPSINFQTAEAAGLAHRRDSDVLVMAAREGRMLVTHDQKTMPRHFAEFITTEPSPGLLVFAQLRKYATISSALALGARRGKGHARFDEPKKIS